MKRSGSRKTGMPGAGSVRSEDLQAIKEKKAVPEIVRPALEFSVKESAVAALSQLSEVDSLAAAVAALLELKNFRAGLSDPALLDQYCALYWHAREQHYPVWLQAYALTMLRTLLAEIRMGGTRQQVYETLRKLAARLAASSQAHAECRAAGGAAAAAPLLANCDDLVRTLRTAVLESYELFCYFLTARQQAVHSRCTGHLFDLHPPVGAEVGKMFPPTLQRAIPLAELTEAQQFQENAQASKKTATDKKADKKAVKQVDKKAEKAGKTAASPAPKAVAKKRVSAKAKPPALTTEAKPSSVAVEVERNASPPGLDVLLESFSEEEFREIMETVLSGLLDEYRRKVATTVAHKQKQTADKLAKVAKRPAK